MSEEYAKAGKPVLCCIGACDWKIGGDLETFDNVVH